MNRLEPSENGKPCADESYGAAISFQVDRDGLRLELQDSAGAPVKLAFGPEESKRLLVALALVFGKGGGH